MNNFQVDQKLVGCQVVMDTSSGKLVGEVRKVDSSGSRISLMNGVHESSQVNLPPMYKVFVKDIISISIVGENPNHPDQFIKVKQQPPVPSVANNISKSNRRSEPLMHHKSLPLHIQKLNSTVNVEMLTNKVPEVRNGITVKPKITDFVVIDTIDDTYSKAIATLFNQSDIGVSMEGVGVGRFGVICWIGVAIKDFVFLFDMCSLGPAGVECGLGRILSNRSILKVTHDCRFLADALLHQYNVKIDNVFDTQVAAAVIEKNKDREGMFNLYVSGLVRCLGLFLPDMGKDQMFVSRVRTGLEKEDEGKWRKRPLPQHLLEGAVFNVCHLRRLRLALMEELTKEVTMGTALYLKEVSDISDDCVSEKQLLAHQLPLSFQDLPRPAWARKSKGFRSNIPLETCDPYVGFTRHIPHVRKNTH